MSSASEPEKQWTYRFSCCILPNAPLATTVRVLADFMFDFCSHV
jgi:hypothetical protein